MFTFSKVHGAGGPTRSRARGIRQVLSGALAASAFGIGGAAAATADGMVAWERGTFAAAPTTGTAAPLRSGVDLGALLGSLSSPSPSPEAFSTRLAAVVTPKAAATYAVQGIQVQPGEPGPLSGLPWHSGASCGSPEFEAWRGRRMDVHTGWAPQTAAAFVDFSTKLNRFADDPAALSLGIPLLMKESKGRYDLCNAGNFDAMHRTFAQNMVTNGVGDTMVRLGWEANGDWFPWAIGTQGPAYKSCFRRIAGIYKSVSPDFKIEWVMAKKGKVHPISSIYPGDDIVDRLGAHFYDRFPTHTTQAVWDAQVGAYFKPTTYGTGSPWGIQAWYDFARSRGKFMVASEWGINDGYAPDGFDNPIHINNMFAFFKSHASGLAYETYFNCSLNNNMYTIYPTQYNPAASSAYMQRWKSGS